MRTADAARSVSVSLPLLVALGALTMLGPFGTDAFLPAFPVMASELDGANGGIQLSLTGFTLGMAAGQLFAGPLSDGVGRRRPLLVGSAAMAVAGIGAALAPNLFVLILCCAAMGLGASFGIVVGRAVLADLVDGPPLTQAYALLGTLTALGPVLGPIIGVGVMHLFGWRTIFVGLGILAAVSLVAAAVIVRESLPRERRVTNAFRGLPRNIAAALRSRAFLGGATVIWFGFAGLFAYIAASPFLIQSVLGMSPLGYSIIFAVNGCGLIVTGVITARLSGRWSEHVIMAIGLTVEGLGAAIILVTALTGTVSVWTLLPALFLIAASMGFLFGPATTFALHGLRHVAGTALAILGAVQFLGAGIVAPLVELGGAEDPVPFAIVVSVCTALAWVGWVVFQERLPQAVSTTREGEGHVTT